MFLGHRVYLKAKAGGDNSMPEKRGHWKTLKVPSRKTRVISAKAGLPESQSPAVQPHTRCYSVWDAALPGAARSVLRTATSDWQGDGERLHSRG